MTTDVGYPAVMQPNTLDNAVITPKTVGELLGESADDLAASVWALLEAAPRGERIALIAGYLSGLRYGAEQSCASTLAELVGCVDFCQSRGWLPLNWGM